MSSKVTGTRAIHDTWSPITPLAGLHLWLPFTTYTRQIKTKSYNQNKARTLIVTKLYKLVIWDALQYQKVLHYIQWHNDKQRILVLYVQNDNLFLDIFFAGIQL